MRSFNAFFDKSAKVGRLFGIPISVHITILFFLLPLLVRRGNAPAWFYLEYIAGVVLSILLHELGHALTAKRYGLKGLSIMLHGFGGFAVSSGYRTPRQALMITLAGPAVTLCLGILWPIGSLLLESQTSFSSSTYHLAVIESLGRINVILAAMNMAPSLPFDGGNALMALLRNKHSEFAALRLVGHTGLLVSPALILLGLFAGLPLGTMFGIIGILTSYNSLRQTGGINFREFGQQRRERKEREAYNKRKEERSQAFLDEVRRRTSKREEDERLKKLFGSDD